MSISSKISVLYLLVVLFSIKQSVCTSSSETDEPPNLCKAKDQDDFEMKLRATMLFRKALILIDHNWMVYQVPPSSMNNSYSQLLIDIIAQPFEEVYPAFKTHENWSDIKPHVISIYNINLKAPYMYMVGPSPAQGICYNMDTSEFMSGKPDVGDLKEVRITDTGLNQFSIVMNGTHVLLLYWNNTWTDDGRQVHGASFLMGFMYYTWNRTNPNLKNITVINEQFDASKVLPTEFGFEDLGQHLPPGFVYRGNFHFFDYKYVFTFPISPLELKLYPWTNDPVPIHATNPVAITAVKDYFKCVHLKLSSNTYPPDPYSLDPGASTGKSSYWIWIVVAIVLFLAIAVIALLVWYFMLGSKGKDSKSRKHSSGNNRRFSSSKQKLSTQASIKQDTGFSSKQRPSTQASSKKGNSFASKKKPSSLKKK